MIEAQLIFGGFKSVLYRPTMSFDFRQRFDGRPTRRPCREEGKISVCDLATDQQAARPDLSALSFFTVIPCEVSKLEIGPIM